MVSKYRGGPLPNGRFMAYKCGLLLYNYLLTGMILQVDPPKVSNFSTPRSAFGGGCYGLSNFRLLEDHRVGESRILPINSNKLIATYVPCLFMFLVA